MRPAVLVPAILACSTACVGQPVAPLTATTGYSLHSAVLPPPHLFVTNNTFLLTGDRTTPNTVTILDAQDDSKVAVVHVGIGSYNVAVTPDGSAAYVTNLLPLEVNSQIGEVTVISTSDNTVTATIQVGRLPRGLAVTPDGKHVYVVNSGAGTLSVIETAGNTVVATVPVSPAADGLNGIAIIPDGTFAYLTHFDTDRVTVVNLESGGVVASIPVGQGPVQPAVTPDGGHVYVNSIAAGSVSVIATASNTVVETVNVGTKSSTGDLIVTPDGHSVYVAIDGAVAVIETASNTLTATIPVGSPHGLAVTPDGREVYVTNLGGNSIVVIDVSSNMIDRAIPDVGIAPFDVVFVPLISAEQAAEALLDEIVILADTGVLDDGVANSLISKLENVLNAITADRPNAINLLNAFINEVLALMPPPEPGTLTIEQGRALIEAAEAAIELLDA